MFYEEEYPFYEPSLADDIINEFKEKMQSVLLDSVKNEIEQIKQENISLKQQNEKLQNRVNEVNQKEREIERQKKDLMYQVRKERLNDLLKDFQVIMYRVYGSSVKIPKCNKCNDKRQITFISPSGKTMIEPCACDVGKLVYVPQEYICTSFAINRSDKNKMSAWYKMHIEKDGDDYCSYDSNDYAETVYKDGMSYEDLKKKSTWSVYFKTKEECQKYCDWLNNQESK